MEVRNHILQARNDLDEMVLPFWRQNMMYRESLAMIRRENGEITAKLLFPPPENFESPKQRAGSRFPGKGRIISGMVKAQN